MNSWEILSGFEESLKTFAGYRGQRRHFCFWNKGFACLPEDHTTELHPVLMRLNHRHYEDGLTSEEWDMLGAKALKIWNDKNK